MPRKRSLYYEGVLIAGVLLVAACQLESTESAASATDLGSAPRIFAIGGTFEGAANSGNADGLSSSTKACVLDTDCDDGDRCTDDVCDNGTTQCIHLPLPCPEYCLPEDKCDDGNPCTTDECGEDEICAHIVEEDCDAVPCDDLKECEDGDPCTQDACLQGWCNHFPSISPSCTE